MPAPCLQSTQITSKILRYFTTHKAGYIYGPTGNAIFILAVAVIGTYIVVHSRVTGILAIRWLCLLIKHMIITLLSSAYCAPSWITHLGREKNGHFFADDTVKWISWMEMYEFRLEFNWIVFLRAQLKYTMIGSDNGLAPTRGHYLNQWWLVG